MKGRIVLSILLVFSLLAVGRVVLTEETKSKSSEQDKKVGSYEITDKSLTKLKEKELPEEILDKLAGLKKQKYTSEEEFLSALEKAIGKEQTAQYKSQILKAAWYYNPKDRREPFKSPVESFTPGPASTPLSNGACPSPLGQFELGELRVVGILLGESGDRAKVRAPDGKSYTITIETCIGKFKGAVISFSENCVTVKETKRFQEGDKITVKEPETQLCLKPLEEEKT